MNQMTTKEILDLMTRRGVTLRDLAETFLSDKNATRIMDALENFKKRRTKV